MPDPSSPTPFIRLATPRQAAAILGAMRAVSAAGRGSTPADAQALNGVARYVFGQPGAAEGAAGIEPDALASDLAGSDLAKDAVELLAVMAAIDAPADNEKMSLVLRFAGALGVHERFLDEIADVTRGRVAEAMADMTQANMESILGKPWPGGVIEDWLLPYRGSNEDPELVRRFETLGHLGPLTFGRAFWDHFKRNSYAFPGAPKGLNAAFSVPHDTVHVLTGYDTTGGGEILASTFTGAMHRVFPLAGHILPAIFSWHLNVQINAVAGKFEGSLDPQEVWRAWAAGAAAKVDSFAPGWDFWAHVDKPIEALRIEWGLPAEGLRPLPAA
jgi:hypothetical protein